MTQFYGYKKLAKPDDWSGLAGSEKWRRTRSAYELAYSWQLADGLPVQVAECLRASPNGDLNGLSVDVALVEKPVFLDTFIGPSMTDIMAHGRNARGDAIVIAVEGKADESFGLRTNAWLRGDSQTFAPTQEIKPTRRRRLDFLADTLHVAISDDASVRYQLLHRTVSAVLDAELSGSSIALVLVHAFGAMCDDNWHDFRAFGSLLGLPVSEPGHVYGPAMLGVGARVKTYFAWCQDDVYAGD